jgi:hypothetical protein
MFKLHGKGIDPWQPGLSMKEVDEGTRARYHQHVEAAQCIYGKNSF